MKRDISIVKMAKRGHKQVRDTVEAEIIGVFGVHRRINKQGAPWTVTHIPTGFRVAGGRTKALAMAKARALKELFGVEFESEDADVLVGALRVHPKREVLRDIRRTTEHLALTITNCVLPKMVDVRRAFMGLPEETR